MQMTYRFSLYWHIVCTRINSEDGGQTFDGIADSSFSFYVEVTGMETTMIELLAIGMPGTTELLIILGILVLVFGGSKIPDLARGIGEGITNFKEGLNEGREELQALEDQTSSGENGDPER